MSIIKTVQDKRQARTAASRTAEPVELKKEAARCGPLPHEVATRAYFTYLNEGSPQGQDEKHWLEAEVQLHAEIARGGHSHHG